MKQLTPEQRESLMDDNIYHSKRAAHLSALWGIVNWKEIEKRFL